MTSWSQNNSPEDAWFSAMEQALEKAARVKYGQDRDIRVTINRESGDIDLNSYLEVVEKVDLENEKTRNRFIDLFIDNRNNYNAFSLI